jgi:hypothetical protein
LVVGYSFALALLIITLIVKRFGTTFANMTHPLRVHIGIREVGTAFNDQDQWVMAVSLPYCTCLPNYSTESTIEILDHSINAIFIFDPFLD